MKEPNVDYIKVFMWIVGIINTVLSPILITWLKKTYGELKKSNETNVKLKKKLEDDSISLEHKNEAFKLQMKNEVTEALSAIMKDIDRKLGISNYALDRNRKEIDSLCDRLITESDKFDKRVADSTIRLKSEMITKETYYKETSKFKEDFLMSVISAKAGLKSFNTNSGTNQDKLIKDLRSIARKVEILNNKFDNEKKSNDKMHNLTRKLLSAGLSERKQLEIKHNKLKVDIKTYKTDTSLKLDNYNKLLSGLKGKIDKK